MLALSRPEKSLHYLVNNPVTSLHIFFNPKYRLHLFYQIKQKRAMLRSNSPGIIWSEFYVLELNMGYGQVAQIKKMLNLEIVDLIDSVIVY